MKRTLLIGPAMSGKSYTANMIRKTYRLVTELNGRTLKSWKKNETGDWFFGIMFSVKESPDLIIIDEIPKNRLEELMSLFFNPELITERRSVGPVTIQADILLVCECKIGDIPTGMSYKRRYNIINCLAADNAGVTMKMLNPDPIS
jgi:hypothetical protein